MSLIEQAAKRLEELRKSGVEINGPFDERAPAAPAERASAPAPAARPEQPAPEAAGPGRSASLASVAATKRSEARPADPGRVSRTVRLDLERLARTGLVTPDAPRSQLASEFRMIKRPLLANAQPNAIGRMPNANLVMVTSALSGEGKSFTAVNLAMSMAMELDTTVLLVDADVAKPSVLEILGLPTTRGLMDVLTNPKLDLSSVLLRTNVDKLSLLPAGTLEARATELLASDAMTRLVEDLASRYPDRMIIFDSPPLLLTTESTVLAKHMGQIVLVVEAERTTEGTLKQALETVEKCPIVMTVLNKARASDLGAYYGYGYGYGSRHAPEQGPTKDGE